LESEVKTNIICIKENSFYRIVINKKDEYICEKLSNIEHQSNGGLFPDDTSLADLDIIKDLSFLDQSKKQRKTVMFCITVLAGLSLSALLLMLTFWVFYLIQMASNTNQLPTCQVSNVSANAAPSNALLQEGLILAAKQDLQDAQEAVDLATETAKKNTAAMIDTSQRNAIEPAEPKPKRSEVKTYKWTD
jgi:hypothetical protein